MTKAADIGLPHTVTGGCLLAWQEFNQMARVGTKQTNLLRY